MAATVTKDQILDAMVAALAPLGAAPGPGYLKKLSRYTGEFTTQEAFQAGVVGHTPAVLIAFGGERRVRTTIGRRVDRVEGTYFALGVSESARGREDRAKVLGWLEDVRQLLGARAFGLPIRPLQWQRDDLLRDDDKALAYLSRYTSQYHADYTVDPGADVLESALGGIYDPAAPARQFPVERTYP
jgi:hypothetical protein